MSANETVLGALHTKVAEVLNEALDGQTLEAVTDEEGNVIQEAVKMAPSAAIIAAATKFLKDNNITCAPSKDNAIGALEQKMKDRAERRKERASKADLAAATEQQTWLESGMVGNA